MLYSSGEVFPCTCTRVYAGIPCFFYIRLSTNPHRLYTKKICHCKICKIRMVIAFIAIFRALLNACSPGVIHNFTKKGKKISTAISACKQASAGYIHRITEVMHHNCAHFVDNFYLLIHKKKKTVPVWGYPQKGTVSLRVQDVFPVIHLQQGGSSRYARPGAAIYIPGPASEYPDCPSPLP